MSASIKSLLSYALIELCREHTAKKLTTTQLIERSGVSRQVFYNNFHDLQDLILWTYINRVQLPGNTGNHELRVLSKEAYTKEMEEILKRHQQLLPFMRYAFRDTSQNCLRVSGSEWIIQAEKESVRFEYDLQELSPEADYVIRCLTKGFLDYVGDWCLAGAKSPSAERLAEYIVNLRFRSYRDLFAGRA